MTDQGVPETPSTASSQEKDKEQLQICDYGAMFRDYLYSKPVWYVGTSSKNYMLSCTLPNAFSPVYSVEKEPSAPSEPLKIEELYSKKHTPFEWTGEYMDLDLEKKIESYNSIARGMEIILHEDGTHAGGYINVNMTFNRPIQIVEGVVPPAVHDVTNTSESTAKIPLLTITEFNLPPNTTEAIYIDNKTTTRQMIVDLFKKLRMIDYPGNYALYEYEPQIDETAGTLTKKLTQISDYAYPLKVVLNWPIPHCGRALVLMEINSGAIMCGLSAIPYRTIVLNTTGLKEEQVTYDVWRNFQTGLSITTYFKRNMISKQSGYDQETIWSVFVSVSFFVIFFGIFMMYYLEISPEFIEERKN